MIVSNQFEFVFMHNPKVGGTSVRRTIKRFSDGEAGFYSNDPDPDSPLHRIDRAHIGLDEFRRFYPDIWARARGYQFFALWRHPKDRIYSSVQQYSRNFTSTDIRFLAPAKRRDFLMKTLDLLNGYETAEGILGYYELSHFRPQWIYLFSEQEGVMVEAIPLARINRLFSEIGKRTGVVDLQPEQASNSSEWNLPLPDVISKLLANKRLRVIRAIPGVTSLTRLARRLMVDNFRRPATDNFGLSASDQETVNAFLLEFYAKDFERLPLNEPVPHH